jgi:hypothetical protein
MKLFVLEDAKRRLWVDRSRLEEVTATYLRSVLCRPDTCRSLSLENEFVAGPARGTTGQNTTFSANKSGNPKVAADDIVVTGYVLLRLDIPTNPSRPEPKSQIAEGSGILLTSKFP